MAARQDRGVGAVSNVLDLEARRFAAAPDSTAVTPEQVLQEALRRVRSGEWSPTSLIVVGINDYKSCDEIECMHGGPASTNERIGMLWRAQHVLFAERAE